MLVTSGTRARVAGRGRVGRGLLASLALAWVLLLAGVLLGAPPARTRADASVSAACTDTPPPTAPPTSVTTSCTPTASPDATAVATIAPTVAATATTQATDVPTNTPSSSSSGNSGGVVGPQPTRQNLAQPTVGATQGGPTSSFSASDLNSPGFLIFSTLGCVFGLLGLGAALVTWYLLVSEGWGPLLKAVLLGNRKGQRRFPRRSPDSARGSRAGERMAAPVSPPRGGWR